MHGAYVFGGSGGMASSFWSRSTRSIRLRVMDIFRILRGQVGFVMLYGQLILKKCGNTDRHIGL